MKNFCESFLYSSKELKSVRNLVIVAMLMTVGIVINLFTIPITPVMRISLGFLAISMIGMLFGPIVAGMCGGMSDIINYLIIPNGPYFPGFTISGILAGILYGIVLYNKKITLARCIIAIIIETVAIDIFLNTFWLSILYGKGFTMLIPLRAFKDIIMIPIKVFIMYFLLRLAVLHQKNYRQQ
ncbi:hypothetical protein CDLVIII_3567 [Clostridium sp. DL-VIII]|uniref:folate family ECF transporter S component n=1 Tax=Clostridium sp. DL-VIII TaxID=641107 RepID=UPI00023AFBCB|nr:folate family ECF transporter S component [Clostridium sp. DL-VIII]EHJ00126.1 hypothetical protein CDLVIII_3567 [Clostridium sp. DL-VIII]